MERGIVMESIFLTKAKRNLQAAQLLFDHVLHDESANRAYYAAFQAAVATLCAVGVQAEGMSHEAVQSTFSRELIHRRKIYPGHFRSYLPDMQVARIEADYKNRFVSKKVASQQLKSAKEFVEKVEQEMST